MDYSKITLVDMLKTKMGYTHQRQDVLAQNIANIDTPGYKAKDVRAPDFKNMMAAQAHRVSLARTNEGHMSMGLNGGDLRVEKERKPFAVTPMQNSVSLEDQMAKVAENTAEHKKVINLYERTTAMFKKALTAQ